MSTGASDRDAQRSKEAQRVLAAVDRDSEALGTSRFAAITDRTIRHFSGGEQAGKDPVELWATRIGRIAGLVAFIGLAAYLLFTYVIR